jgi:hypothetical protein
MPAVPALDAFDGHGRAVGRDLVRARVRRAGSLGAGVGR